MTDQQQQFLDESVGPAIQVERETGCPAELSLAQSAEETGWGAHVPAGSNNRFGVKALKGQPYVDCLTEEYVGGKKINVMQAFAAYPSVLDSFLAHGKLITTGEPYAQAWSQYRKTGDLKGLIYGIAPHYAPGNLAYPSLVEALATESVITSALQIARAE